MDTSAIPLGKLKSLGITEAWKVALYLPESWDDYRVLLNSAPASDVEQACFKGQLQSFDVRFDKAPRTVCKLVLADHSIVGFTLFGDTRGIELREGKPMVVHGRLSSFRGEIWLEGATVVEPSMVGRLIPRYKGIRGVMKPETVRARIFGMLKGAVPMAADWINQNMEHSLSKLNANTSETSILDTLKEAHLPKTIESGCAAQSFLENLAALNLALSISDIQKKRCSKAAFSTPVTDNLPIRVKAFPFTMTDEQKNCVRDAIRDIRKGVMHRVLSGEVGTGKTAVYGLLAAVCIDGGAQVAIMGPNQSLVRQIHAEIANWWPDLEPQLITGDTDAINDNTRLFVGTTALLHRKLPELSLVIADEQHKFSRDQREQLICSGVHLLEVSATCIPRSQALIRYGALAISKLEHCHVEKSIRTKVWAQDKRTGLFDNIKRSIKNGDKILVIYPKREGEQETGKLPSADQAYHAWNKAFPGNVRLAHGGLSGDDNQQAINDVSSGKAHILISTTVVEVGINIPGLRHAVVVHAERFGLTTLHQIRGRVSREGGSGFFDLYLPVEVKEAALKRLSVLETTDNGFKVAEMDMQLRGFGDLSSNSSKQTGSDDSFLIGKNISIDAMDRAIELIY